MEDEEESAVDKFDADEVENTEAMTDEERVKKLLKETELVIHEMLEKLQQLLVTNDDYEIALQHPIAIAKYFIEDCSAVSAKAALENLQMALQTCGQRRMLKDLITEVKAAEKNHAIS